MKRETALIAAGGTGGHIYPALAVAKSLLKQNPNLEIHFVGTKTGLETQLVPREGFELHYLSIGRLNRNVGWGERVRTLIQLPFSFWQSLQLLIKYRPRFVLGVGGHASGPLLLVAALVRYPTLIWEPNAIPGLANRLLSRFVQASFVVFDDAARFLKSRKIEKVGMPVRDEIECLHNQTHHSKKPLRILAFGGSQGARYLNTIVSETFKQPQWQGKVELVHQTGKLDFQRVQGIYGGMTPPWIEIHEYLYDMGARYAECEIVIARSGTGTLSELAAAKRASILVPLPTAADDHQRKNAEVFASAGAAVMIVQNDLTVEKLTDQILKLLENPSEVLRMAQTVEKFFVPKAAEAIASQILTQTLK